MPANNRNEVCKESMEAAAKMIGDLDFRRHESIISNESSIDQKLDRIISLLDKREGVIKIYSLAEMREQIFK